MAKERAQQIMSTRAGTHKSEEKATQGPERHSNLNAGRARHPAKNNYFHTFRPIRRNFGPHRRHFGPNGAAPDLGNESSCIASGLCNLIWDHFLTVLVPKKAPKMRQKGPKMSPEAHFSM